jgi:hypothetical protein
VNQYRNEGTEGWNAETKEVQTEMEETKPSGHKTAIILYIIFCDGGIVSAVSE